MLMVDESQNTKSGVTGRVWFWRWAALLGSAALVLTLDRVSKTLVMQTLNVGESLVPIPFLSDYFGITLSHNTGAAFSIFPQAGDLFLLVAIAMTVGIVLFYRRFPAGHWIERIALGLLLGGAMGNAIDRLQYTFVIDWVHLKIPGVISNVSNFADHGIVIGIGILFLTQWGRPAPKAVQPEPSEPDSAKTAQD
jgi:signal peptidase II